MDSTSMQLRVWHSPRDTTVWASDEPGGAQVRAVLDEAGVPWWPVYIYEVRRDAATNIDIGIDAMVALEALARAGYTFAWHPSVITENRRERLFDVKVVDLGGVCCTDR